MCQISNELNSFSFFRKKREFCIIILGHLIKWMNFFFFFLTRIINPSTKRARRKKNDSFVWCLLKNIFVHIYSSSSFVILIKFYTRTPLAVQTTINQFKSKKKKRPIEIVCKIWNKLEMCSSYRIELIYTQHLLTMIYYKLTFLFMFYVSIDTFK